MDFQVSFLYGFSGYAIVAGLMLAMTISYVIGSKFAHSSKIDVSENKFGPIESSILALLALLLSFTFGQSAQRFEVRRQVLVDEANNIEAVIRKSNLYPEEERKPMRDDLRQYVEARIAFYDAGVNKEKIVQTLEEARAIQARLWDRVTRVAQNRDNLIPTNNMVPSLTAMTESMTKRSSAGLSTIPDSVMWMLFALCVLSSFTVGFAPGENKPWWLGVGVFIIAIGLAVFLIIDMDRPRLGTISLDSPQRNIVNLRQLLQDN